MFIYLKPSLNPVALTLARSGDTLVINGENFDFSVVPEGGILPGSAIASDFITDAVRRVGGRLHISVLLPIEYSASEAARFPAPLDNPADGPIALPE